MSDFLPIPDACVHPGCGLPESKHLGWDRGGPTHAYKAAAPLPNPERVAHSVIETSWTCTHCGARQEVEGVADREWMECSACQKDSFVEF